MALLGTPLALSGEETEYGWWGFGYQKHRTLYKVRVTWACDLTGSNSPPSTYAHSGGSTCNFMRGEPQVQHGKVNGTYMAIYEFQGSWVLS